MSAQGSIRARLDELARSGSLPSSSLSNSLRSTLRPLLDSHVVSEVPSGAGRRLVVLHPEALARFIQDRFPSTESTNSGRAAGVALFRDSKSVANQTPPILRIRAWQDPALLLDTTCTGAADATRLHGLFACVLAEPHRYQLTRACALVENPEIFLRFEQLQLPTPVAIDGHGRLHSRILDWLASHTSPTFSVLHLPDYDPTGLSEFVRLRQHLGPRVSLHLPANLDSLFARYSNPRLLDHAHSRDSLARLRSSHIPEVQAVCNLIDRHNAGLEQEALLLPPRSADDPSAPASESPTPHPQIQSIKPPPPPRPTFQD